MMHNAVAIRILSLVIYAGSCLQPVCSLAQGSGSDYTDGLNERQIYEQGASWIIRDVYNESRNGQNEACVEINNDMEAQRPQATPEDNDLNLKRIMSNDNGGRGLALTCENMKAPDAVDWTDLNDIEIDPDKNSDSRTKDILGGVMITSYEKLFDEKGDYMGLAMNVKKMYRYLQGTAVILSSAVFDKHGRVSERAYSVHCENAFIRGYPKEITANGDIFIKDSYEYNDNGSLKMSEQTVTSSQECNFAGNVSYLVVKFEYGGCLDNYLRSIREVIDNDKALMESDLKEYDLKTAASDIVKNAGKTIKVSTSYNSSGACTRSTEFMGVYRKKGSGVELSAYIIFYTDDRRSYVKVSGPWGSGRYSDDNNYIRIWNIYWAETQALFQDFTHLSRWENVKKPVSLPGAATRAQEIQKAETEPEVFVRHGYGFTSFARPEKSIRMPGFDPNNTYFAASKNSKSYTQQEHAYGDNAVESSIAQLLYNKLPLLESGTFAWKDNMATRMENGAESRHDKLSGIMDAIMKKANKTELDNNLYEAVTAVMPVVSYVNASTFNSFMKAFQLVMNVSEMADTLGSEEVSKTVNIAELNMALRNFAQEQRGIYKDLLSRTAGVYKEIAILLEIDDEAVSGYADEYAMLGDKAGLVGIKIAVDAILDEIVASDDKALVKRELEAKKKAMEELIPIRDGYMAKIEASMNAFTRTILGLLKDAEPVLLKKAKYGTEALIVLEQTAPEKE